MAFFVIGILTASNSWAQGAQKPAGAGVTGRWIVTADFYGTPINYFMELVQQGEKVNGTFGGDKLEGTFSGNALHFLAKDDQGGTEECSATLQGDTLTGTAIFIDADDKDHPSTHQFTAKLAPQRPSGPAKRHEFTPTVFYRQFSPMNKPVLTFAGRHNSYDDC